MNLLINIHKDSPDVVLFSLEGKNISRTTITKEELIEYTKELERRLAVQLQWRAEIIDLIERIFPHMKERK